MMARPLLPLHTPETGHRVMTRFTFCFFKYAGRDGSDCNSTDAGLADASIWTGLPEDMPTSRGHDHGKDDTPCTTSPGVEPGGSCGKIVVTIMKR